VSCSCSPPAEPRVAAEGQGPIPLFKMERRQSILMSKCGCGRSPTGMCKGWHGLSDEEYEKKLKEYKEANPEA